jgi:hypothetical protein
MTVELLAGAVAGPLDTLEREEHEEPEAPAEPEGDDAAQAVVAVIGSARAAGPDGFVDLRAEAWSFQPESEADRLRLVPAGGWLLGLGGPRHLDLAARYDLELVPFHDASSGALSLSADVGTSRGRHDLDAVVAAEDRAYFAAPAWSFRAAEVGAQWSFAGDVARARVRVGGQANAAPDDLGREVAGSQARLTVGVATGGEHVDLAIEARTIVAAGGIDDELVRRPPFTPFGSYVEDQDGPSAGGFVQQRLGADLGARSGRVTVAASGLVRARVDESEAGARAVDWLGHASTQVSVDLGAHVAVESTVGVNALGWTGPVDPYAWVGLVWQREPKDLHRSRSGS